MESSEPPGVADLEELDDILEDARERLPSARYNAKTLEFVLHQMEKMAPVRAWVAQEAALAAAEGRDGWRLDEELRPGCGGDAHGGNKDCPLVWWRRLKDALRRGERLITRHTSPVHSGKFSRFSVMRNEAEGVCRELKRCVALFAAANLHNEPYEPIKTVVDTKCVVEDKVYLYYYLALVVQELSENKEWLGSKPGKVVHREWESMRSEHRKRRQHLAWIDDSTIESLQREGKVIDGGCGLVVRALWKDVHVVVKTYIDVARELSLEAKASFFASIEIQRSMACAHVVRVFAVSPAGVVLMEQAKCNLAGLYMDAAELPWVTKCQLLLEAAKGLKFVHERGMLHGAVKSSNFLIFGSGLGDFTVKVSDFGMAVVKSELLCKKTALQHSSSLWAAPEVLEGGMATMASDVFGLGVVMFEVVSQRAAYLNVGSPKLLLGQKKRGEDPCAVPHDCPEQLMDLMRRCVLPNPEDRPCMENVVLVLKHICQMSTCSSRSVSRRRRFYVVEAPALPSMLYGSKSCTSRASDQSMQSDRILAVSNDSGINFRDIFTNSRDDATSGGGWSVMKKDKGKPGGGCPMPPTKWAGLQTDIISAIARKLPKEDLRKLRLANRHWCTALYSTVEHIEVSQEAFGNLGTDWVSNLGKFRHLRSLRLPAMTNLEFVAPGCQSASSFLFLRTEELSPLHNLLSLDLRYSEVEDWHLNSLEDLTKLTKLNLSHSRITNAGLRSLSSFKALQDLGLGHTMVGDGAMKYIAELSNLHTLELGFTKMRYWGMQGLGRLRRLKSLGLGGIDLCGRGAGPLSKLTHLQSLSLVFAKDLDNAAMISLSRLSELEVLNMGLTAVGDKGVAAVAGFAPWLETCDLRGTAVTDAVGPSLALMTNLKSLHLGDTAVGDGIVGHLRGLERLESVVLAGTQVGSEAAQQLVELPALKLLGMG
ncbi:unnamed protein product [Ostreobium quekettii]|uniref:Protein kinase domain-containing protein n=1 Tax=Ostreobium quekettii TaxID=121088 RepID=A0A8S1IUP7_9CHLO|nr:unnamed protein product [Ostreobium quekettii]|eukprot:evm.model.scf_2387.1 EVM.evm.TU.scf_2387.1   scf_2387:10914-19857(-)